MQNRLYMKDIGPLPPYPFLTFTLMQLLLYVFFLLLSFIYEPFGSYICIWMKSNYDWLKMKSAQLNMLYSHLDFDNGAEKYRGGKVRRPLCPPPLGPPYSLPITPVSGFCLPHWKALKTVICHPLYVCRYRPVTPPHPPFLLLNYIYI